MDVGDRRGVFDEEGVAEGVEVARVGVEGGLLLGRSGEGGEGEEVHGEGAKGMKVESGPSRAKRSSRSPDEDG